MLRQYFFESLFHWRSSDNLILEQYRNLRPQVPTMYLAVLINMLFLAGVSAPEVGSAAFTVPAIAGALIIGRLITMMWARPRTTPLTTSQMLMSMNATLIIATLLSVALDVWVYTLQRQAIEAQHYIALFAALCTISCAACLSSMPLAAYTVIIVGTVPVATSLLVSEDAAHASTGANILLIAPLIIGLVHRQHQQLRRLVESRSDIAAEKLKASNLAYHDSLTGLANRRAFLDELDAATGPGSFRAVGMIDLDGFKLINDTYGHQTGDAVLVEAAKRFESVDLGDALIARLGGDEFAVLLRDADCIDDAQARLVRLAAVFDRCFVVDGKAFRLRASIGMAHDASDVASTLGLINRADLAMYEAKRGHSGAICMFNTEMEARIRRRLIIEQALSTPAESDLIVLQYQPIVDSATNRILSFEALARWTHPTLGIISPAEFIPLAEQFGVTRPITMHLLSMALAAASTWPENVGLSFNLSGAELNSTAVPGQVLAMMTETGFDPARLSIEVTETALLTDFVTARAALCALQQGGVSILLDDFGAGYASIGYLREFKFDGIKLDGSLIASLTESEPARDLLVGVLHLCQSIGAPVTAEMVETAAQHDLLRALGVVKQQGFFLSRPLTAEHALAACRGQYRGMRIYASPVVRANRRGSLNLA